jgi:hypothetical protein
MPTARRRSTRARYGGRRRLLAYWTPYQMHQPSIFWRRAVYEKVGPLREDLHLIMDYDYWLRISRPCSAGEDARLMSAYIQPFAKRQRHVLRPAGRNAEVVHDEHTHRRQALPVSAEPMRAAVAVLRWNRSAARRRVFADRRKFPA